MRRVLPYSDTEVGRIIARETNCFGMHYDGLVAETMRDFWNRDTAVFTVVGGIRMEKASGKLIIED